MGKASAGAAMILPRRRRRAAAEAARYARSLHWRGEEKAVVSRRGRSIGPATLEAEGRSMERKKKF